MLSRLKLQIDPVIAEILEQIPEPVWASKTTTFFDPAIAGGQIVHAIEQKLRSYGHTDNNISGRVYGCEKLPHRVKYAVTKYDLKGHYASADFLEEDITDMMKFDAIVTNSPYHDPNNDKRMLWNQFLDKIMELTKDDGYIAAVVPTTWLTSNSNVHNSYKLFEELQVNTAVVYDKTDKPFAEGTTVSYIIAQNTPRHTTTPLYFARYAAGTKDLVANINTATDKEWPSQLTPINLNIHNKLQALPRIKFVKTCEFHSQKLQKKNMVSDVKTAEFPHTYYISAAIIRYTSEKMSTHNQWKVMVPLTSTINRAVVANNCGHGADMLTLYVADKITAQNIQKLFNTKMYKFIGKLYKNGRNQPLQDLFPIVDFNRVWTDAELYKQFKLTQEEIDYIESDIK